MISKLYILIVIWKNNEGVMEKIYNVQVGMKVDIEERFRFWLVFFVIKNKIEKRKQRKICVFLIFVLEWLLVYLKFIVFIGIMRWFRNFEKEFSILLKGSYFICV